MSREDCDVFQFGRPGDGVFRVNLAGWRAPFSYRLDERGNPARYDRNGNGTHRITSRADVPRLRAMDVLGGCSGDGHYICRRCIYWRDEVQPSPSGMPAGDPR